MCYAKSGEAKTQAAALRRLPLRITRRFALDRIVHSAIRIQMGDVNMRERAKRRQEKLEAKRSS